MTEIARPGGCSSDLHPFEIVLTHDPETNQYKARVAAGLVNDILAPQLSPVLALADIYDVYTDTRIYLKLSLSPGSLDAVDIVVTQDEPVDDTSTYHRLIGIIKNVNNELVVLQNLAASLRHYSCGTAHNIFLS